MDSREHPLQRLYRSASSVTQVLAAARAAGRSQLLEPEGLAIARLLGFTVPALRVVEDADQLRDAGEIELPAPAGDVSDPVVVKAIAADLVHKSDSGAVARVRRHPQAVAEAIRAMQSKLGDAHVEGYGIYSWIEHARDLAGELIFGLRRTPDFGAVVSVAPGGVYAEHLAAALVPESGVALFSAHDGARTIAERLRRLAVVPMLTGALRGQAQRLALDRLVQAVLALHRLAAQEKTLAELELNPVAVRGGELVALDAVARVDDAGQLAQRPAAAERPIAKLRHLLEPRSIAVVGVSARGRNPGRTIVENVLAAGFPADRLVIVKPGIDELDGCRCVPDLDSLGPVDLLVVAVAAEQAAEMLEEIARRRTAESVILIPGGVGELAGSEGLAARLRHTLDQARRGAGGGPLLCGGNCLGVRSRPGRFDTLFIPRHKLGLGRDKRAREAVKTAGRQLAVVSQSGAFALARASQLEVLDPRYVITLGNQLDLTVGDVLSYLATEAATRVVACYVEGFAPLDGERFLQAATACRRAGRPVILYRAGRTPAGASKAASHTAAMAGDYTVTRELARAAGVVVAETLEDFDDLVSTFTLLHHRPPAGPRLGALSNAGFECVAIADHLGTLQLADFSPATRRSLGALLDANRLGQIVSVSNPLDTTPIFGDEPFAEAAQIVIEDPAVELGLVGCVPMTGALETLEKGPASGGEDLERTGSVVSRLADLADGKPWAAVVDAGRRYDAMTLRLRQAGIPTFRRADRAVRALETFCRWHLETRA